MHDQPTFHRILSVAAALLSLSIAPGVRAISAGPVDVHGSVSVTASYSDEFNYLGETRDQTKLNLVDLVLNGTHRFENGLRAGAQLYAFQIGSDEYITIDWANLDYSFRQWLGVRIGRNKLPLGLYNDAQDLDAIRTFASLPIAFYPKALRALTSSFDGLTIYGNIDCGKAGSLDYQIYGGRKESAGEDSPFVRGMITFASYRKCSITGGVFGSTIFWNTPLEGLRLALSYQLFPKNSLPGSLATTDEIPPFTMAIPTMVDATLGAGTWDHSGLFAGTPASLEHLQNVMKTASAEYTFGKWTLAAEYKRIDITGGWMNVPAFAYLGLPTKPPADMFEEDYYGMVTYQATKRIGLGLYYCYQNVAAKTPGSSHDPDSYTKDWAAAVSFAASDNWIFKLEGHAMSGRSLIWAAGDDNHGSGNAKSWIYLVAKTTFSF